MIDRLLHSKYLKPKRLIGVSCEILPDGGYCWRYCILQQMAGKISVVKCDTVSNLKDLKKEKLSLVPIYLIIEGKGIINKKVKSDTEQSPILQVIPNASAEDFYMSEVESEDGYSLISVMRADAIDNILQLFKDLNFQVVNIHIGSFHVARLCGWFENLPYKITAVNLVLSINPQTHRLIDFNKPETPVEESYMIAGENITSSFLSPFAAALSFFIDEEAPSYPSVQKSRTDFLAHRLFVIGGWGILIVAFLTLLVNYMFYMQYSDKTNALEATINKNSGNLVLLEDLGAELKQKEAFFLQSGFNNKSRFSFYTDQISSTIPSDINLLEFTVNPLLSKIKKEKAVEIRKNIILINGQTQNSIILNDWIKVLESFKWIKKISVIQYAKEQSNKYGEFVLEIELGIN
jgi:hypothetical protein